MLIRKAFKYKLKPNVNQRQLMAQTAGCVRLVWNKALADVKTSLDTKDGYPGYVSLANNMVNLKKQEQTSFLKLVHSQPLQQSLKDLDRAIKDGFKRVKTFPKFKKKASHKSFRYPQGVKVDGNKTYLPKIGWVKFQKSREVDGLIKNATVSFKCGHWYVSFQTELEIKPPSRLVTPLTSIGIDMGVAKFATLSDGTQILPLNSFKNLESKLTKNQRSLARKRKGSKSWLRQKYKVQRVFHKIANVRNDFLHKTSSAISKNHALIVLENLKIGNMTKSAKGTADNPGTNVNAKSGLNKAILDQGWYEFRRQLEYKQLWSGGQVLAVNPKYTSQKCPMCSNVSSQNRITQETFRCISCQHSDNADINAAKNILAAGSTVLAGGDISYVSS